MDSQERTRGWPTWVMTALLALVAAGVSLWFGVRPNLPKAPVGFERGKDGRFVETGEPRTGRPSPFEAHAGVLKAENSCNATGFDVVSGSAGFPCRTLVLLNLSEHPLLQRVGPNLVGRLKQLPHVQTLTYYPSLPKPEEGTLSPDVIVTLDAESIKESHGLGSAKLEAQIVVTAGTHLVQSRASYCDHLTPPIFRFTWRCELRHKSTRSGFESSAARYKHAATNIAQEIGKQLQRTWDKHCKAHGVMPELPATFYPAYRQAPELPFLAKVGAERLVAYHGPMTHNDSMWKIRSDRPPSELLPDIQGEMVSLGWRTHGISTAANSLPHLRMAKDAAALTVFPKQTEATENLAMPGPQKPATGPDVYFVHYEDRMTESEIEGAAEQLLSATTPLNVLLMFESKWTVTQCERAVALIEKRRPETPQARLALARAYHRLKKPELAASALLRAYALSRTVRDKRDLENQIRNAAKQIGVEPPSRKDVTAAMLMELGFVEWQGSAVTLEKEVGFDEPVRTFWRGGDGNLFCVSCWAERQTASDGKTLSAFSYVTDAEGASASGSSGGSGGTERVFTFAGQDTLLLTLEKLPAKERFRIAITRQSEARPRR